MATPDDPLTRLILAMVRLGRRGELEHIQIANNLGVTAAEMTALVQLLWAGPPHRLSPTFLSETLVQTSGGVTATLHRLTEAGLIRRVKDPRDGRRRLVELTDEGVRVARTGTLDTRDRFAEIFAELTDHERMEAAKVIDDLVVAIQAAPVVAPTSAGRR